MTALKCEICHGTGEIVCPGCDGGAVKGVTDKNSTEWESCARCKGIGNIECPTCKGTGEVSED